MSKLIHVQILRAVAALAIAVHHAQSDAVTLAARSGASFRYSDAFPWQAGVDIFFVISGFIMVYASGRLFGAEGGGREFLIRRVARVAPLYWAVTTLYLAVALVAPASLNSAILDPWLVGASYFFIPATRPDGVMQPLYSLGWTLNYEMYFYLLFAVALAWPRRRAVAGLIGVFLVIVAAGALLRPLSGPLAFWSDPIILEFGLGMALGLAQGEGVRLGGSARLALLAAGAIALVMSPLPTGEAGVWPRFVVYGIPAACLVAAAALGHDTGRRDSPLTRLGEAVGDASYALYLVHPFVIRGLREALMASRLGVSMAAWAFVAIALVAAVASAFAVYRLFERPMTRALRRVLEPAARPTRAAGEY